MFQDLRKVHIVCFAVGILGVLIGITGIALAIVFGTAQPTCPTAAPPVTCPQAVAAKCSTNLFSISTGVNIPWNDALNDTSSSAYKQTVANITASLTQSLQSGLNNGPSSSSFYRILAATDYNSVTVQISSLQKSVENTIFAIGNGAISSTAIQSSVPNNTAVETVIKKDNTTYTDVNTAPQACDKNIGCPDCACSTPAPIECSTVPNVQTTPLVLTSTEPTVSSTYVTLTPTATTQGTEPVSSSTQLTTTVTIPSTSSPTSSTQQQSSTPEAASSSTQQTSIVPITSTSSPTSSTQQQSSTPEAASSSTQQTTTVTIPSTSSPSSSTQQQSTTTESASSSTQRTTIVPITSTSSPTSSTQQQSSTPEAASTSTQQTTTVPITSTSSPSSSTQQQSTTPEAASSSTQQTTIVPITSTSSPSSSTQQQSSTPEAVSTSTYQSTPPLDSSTMTLSSVTPQYSTSLGPTTTQICSNPRTVFKGQIGVVFEMLPNSSQQDTINDFVENILMNSDSYGLAVDYLTHDNRTLATSIPYPSTSKYNIQGYGSTRSVDDFKNQVISFNNVIQGVSATSDISDALLYISTNLQAGDQKSALIIVGNNASMITIRSVAIASTLKTSFDIYTVGVGENPVNLSALSSGEDFSFIGNTSQVANTIGSKIAMSSPADYCPPPALSTTTRSISTVFTSPTSPTVPASTSILTTAPATTVKPTISICQCDGRWVYNGDLVIAFEFIKGSSGSQNVTNFINNTLLMNPDSYGLTNDLNGKRPSQLTLVPYPNSSNYPIGNYGSIYNSKDISNYINAFSSIQTDNTDPSISDALDYINSQQLTPNSNTKVVLIVGSNGSDVNSAINSANSLKMAGYIVITVAQTVSADVFKPLASENQYALHIGDGNDADIASQIANLLLDISFVCFDDGSNTPSPITRCPGTQGTSTLPSSSPSSSTQQQSTTPEAVSSSTQQTMSTMISTLSSSISTQNTEEYSTQVSESSSFIGSSSSATQSPTSSTVRNTGSSTIGPTVTSSGLASTEPIATSPYTASTSVPLQSTIISSTASSTVTENTVSSTTPIPSCPSPYKGKIATVFELNTVQAEIQNVVSFVRDNLYNSINYNFTSLTQAINVPYANTDSYGDGIVNYGDDKSLSALQSNIDELVRRAVFTTNPTISDGLDFLYSNRDPGGTKAVVIVVGTHVDDQPASTADSLANLREQGYQIIFVAVEIDVNTFSPNNNPDWKFQVGSSNGQYVADQISSILCHL